MGLFRAFNRSRNKRRGANRSSLAARASLCRSCQLRAAFDADKQVIIHVVAENDAIYFDQLHWLDAQRANGTCLRGVVPRQESFIGH